MDTADAGFDHGRLEDEEEDFPTKLERRLLPSSLDEDCRSRSPPRARRPRTSLPSKRCPPFHLRACVRLSEASPDSRERVWRKPKVEVEGREAEGEGSEGERRTWKGRG